MLFDQQPHISNQVMKQKGTKGANSLYMHEANDSKTYVI